MQLRYRIFLLVGGLFVISTIGGIFLRQYSLNHALERSELESKKAIHARAEKEREKVLSYFHQNIAEAEGQLIKLFINVNTVRWLKEKFEPTEVNYKTNEWSNASSLLSLNPWLDLVQITVRDKLSALIITGPQNLQDLIRIPIDDNLSLIAEKTGAGEYRVLVGVPYWALEEEVNLSLGLHSIVFDTAEDKLYWLLFSVDQLLAMDPSKLIPPFLQIPHFAKALYGTQKSLDEFNSLMNFTRNSIKLTQEALKNYPEIIESLQSEEKTNKWVKERFKNYGFNERSINRQCANNLCLSLSDEQKKLYFQSLNKWNERDEQNLLIRLLSILTGSGVWNFDPLDRLAPKGICSFLQEDEKKYEKKVPYVGYGLYANSVFYDKALPFNATCKPVDSEKGYPTCISTEMELVVPEHLDGVYMVKTMTYGDPDPSDDPATYGTLSVGLSLNSTFQEIALASSVNLFFLTQDNYMLMFNSQGQVKRFPLSEDIKVHEIIKKNKGSIIDASGKEFYVFYLSSFFQDDGHVFIVQTEENETVLINQLRDHTNQLMHSVSYQRITTMLIILLLVFLVLNYLLKHVTGPIKELAAATKHVGSGKLDLVSISTEGKNRTDEIGMLCRAFEKMVAEMVEGEEVRGILNKVVSKEIADKIIEEGVALGGETREVTVLFSDIRHFTRMSETLPPPQVLEILNGCLTVLSEVIDDSKGVIDKYVGDKIMALFGAPVAIENQALQAILCGKTMINVLKEWNRQRELSGQTPLYIGMGIHTGHMVAGNIGAENHRNYTVLGHNVNLAARLCAYAKEMELIITEETLNAPGVKDAIKYEVLSPVRFKGISQPVPIFRVIT